MIASLARASGVDDILKIHSFSDRAILDINQITAYYAYVNRIADGLGVPLEDFWQTTNLTTGV